jgi:hypothetical protein
VHSERRSPGRLRVPASRDARLIFRQARGYVYALRDFYIQEHRALTRMSANGYQ